LTDHRAPLSAPTAFEPAGASGYGRVLLKLSGETMGGGKVGVDPVIVRGIAQQLAEVAAKGTQVAVVMGGTSAEREISLQTGAGVLKALEALFNEADGQWAPGQLLLLFQNTTRMPYAVAATAWGHVLGCKTFNPRVFDALRDFRLTYTNQGPEQLGTGPE